MTSLAFILCSHFGGERSGDSIVISVNSFRGAGLVVQVAKKPGMEDAHLLYDDKEGAGLEEKEVESEEKKAGLWDSLSRWTEWSGSVY